SDSNKLKELYAVKSTFQPAEGVKVLSRSLRFQVYKDKFFASGKPEFDISVFDTKGNLVTSIKRDYQRVRVTKSLKKGIKNWLKKEYKRVFDLFKIVYPDYLPAVRELVVSDGKIYAVTNRKKQDLTECFVFDLDGKLLKETYIPIAYEDIIRVYPFTFNGDKLYQLVSNDDEEEWELHITPVK
ncbi:MAG: hypothetical protein GY765_38030, partial [bacterium]|nr:hypothetical protein [bacterium]